MRFVDPGPLEKEDRLASANSIQSNTSQDLKPSQLMMPFTIIFFSTSHMLSCTDGRRFYQWTRIYVAALTLVQC